MNNLKKFIANRIKMPEIAFEMRRTLKVKKADAPKHWALSMKFKTLEPKKSCKNRLNYIKN